MHVHQSSRVPGAAFRDHPRMRTWPARWHGGFASLEIFLAASAWCTNTANITDLGRFFLAKSLIGCCPGMGVYCSDFDRERKQPVPPYAKSRNWHSERSGEIPIVSNPKCRACGKRIAARRGRGRRLEYCSVQCRRVLEIRRRAWDEELSNLERECLRHNNGGFTTDETRAAAARERDHFLANHPRP